MKTIPKKKVYETLEETEGEIPESEEIEMEEVTVNEETPTEDYDTNTLDIQNGTENGADLHKVVIDIHEEHEDEEYASNLPDDDVKLKPSKK